LIDGTGKLNTQGAFQAQSAKDIRKMGDLTLAFAECISSGPWHRQAAWPGLVQKTDKSRLRAIYH
jgi:hypothetical protein